MGLFSWLFGTREPERVTVRDFVWQSAKSRSRAIVRELAAHLAAGHSALLLAHFPSTLVAFAPELSDAKLPREAIPADLTPKDALRLAAHPAPRVLFGLVRNIKPDEFPASENAPESPLPVLLAERHYLRRHDDRVTRFAEGLGGRATITVHLSLDDHLMKLFAGEWVLNLLRQLGMKEDEAIDSDMVRRRIRKAQDKFLPLLSDSDIPADSPEEWYHQNARG